MINTDGQIAFLNERIVKFILESSLMDLKISQKLAFLDSEWIAKRVKDESIQVKKPKFADTIRLTDSLAMQFIGLLCKRYAEKLVFEIFDAEKDFFIDEEMNHDERT